ncbi:MAG TPA: ABC transporter permease [Micromonosporaceae bacterium]|nr:ABC transporter permease [Micromonosporaceae bacterium]
MGKFLLRRVIYLVLLTIVASAVAYMLAATQLNPRSKYDGRNPAPAVEVVDRQLDSLNMNDKTPLLERFGTWASGVARGDFGKTIDGGSVNEEMGRRMWVSLRLMLIGSILGTLLGVAAGAYGAIKQHQWSDRTLTVMAFVLLSVPTVVLAVLVKNAGIWFNQATGNAGTPILFTTGEITPGLDTWSWVGLKDRAAHLVLPTIVLAMNALAFYSRYQRNSMLDVLGSDFLRTAQAKGLRRWKALTRHGLRTALIPMATFFSYQFALIFVGATFTEKIFGWHGMGEYFVDSITKNDVNAVAGVTFFVAVLVLIAGLLSDIVYAALDPRVRV